MNTPDETLDPVLLRRFASQPEPGADEPFLHQLQERLDRERRWALLRSLALPLAGVLVLVAATPLFVGASQYLGRALALGLATPWLWLCLPLLGALPLLRLRAR